MQDKHFQFGNVINEKGNDTAKAFRGQGRGSKTKPTNHQRQQHATLRTVWKWYCVCDCSTLSRNVNPLRFYLVCLSSEPQCVRAGAFVWTPIKTDSIKLEFELCLRIICHLDFGFCLLALRRTLVNLRFEWTLGPLNNLPTKRTCGACVGA